MSVLKIFADESGTMSIKDDDEIFVVASIATGKDRVIFRTFLVMKMRKRTGMMNDEIKSSF